MSTSLGWFGVALVTVSGAFAGWIEALLVPYYIGSAIVPITLVFAIAGNWYLPRLSRTLVPKTAAAVLPFVAWLLVVLLIASATRPEGDVILPGGDTDKYVSYGLLLLGGLAGIVSIVLSVPVRSRQGQSDAGSPGSPGSSR